MLTKAQFKFIKSLAQTKVRKAEGLFVAEGVKVAGEWLNSKNRIRYIVGTEDYIANNKHLFTKHGKAEVHVVKESELEQLSTLTAPNQVLVVVEKPASAPIPPTGWKLLLDEVKDPGNMGSIIRIADWFGITDVICSTNSADYFQPKVVQAAMGGHLRVNLTECDIIQFLEHNTQPVYAAVLEGDNLFTGDFQSPGIIVIGNESQGISQAVQLFATHKITIPRIGGAESLNAAVSAGIICATLVGAAEAKKR